MDAKVLDELKKISDGQTQLANSLSDLGSRVSCLEDVQRSQSATGGDVDVQSLIQRLQDRFGQLSAPPTGDSSGSLAADSGYQSQQLTAGSLLCPQAGLSALGDNIQEDFRQPKTLLSQEILDWLKNFMKIIGRDCQTKREYLPTIILALPLDA